MWLTELVQGAVADLMRTDQGKTDQLIGGGVLVDADKSGAEVTTPVGGGWARGGQEFNSPSDAVLRDRVTSVAARFGLSVRSLAVLHPLDSALEVSFVVPDGKVDWTIDQLSGALQGSPQDIEGDYIELYGLSGQPLLRTGTTARVAGGGLWFADGQDLRFGAQHG